MTHTTAVTIPVLVSCLDTLLLRCTLTFSQAVKAQTEEQDNRDRGRGHQGVRGDEMGWDGMRRALRCIVCSPLTYCMADWKYEMCIGRCSEDNIVYVISQWMPVKFVPARAKGPGTQLVKVLNQTDPN